MTRKKQPAKDLRPWLRKALAEVVNELSSGDKRIKGLALEALAFKLMRPVGLNYVTTRLRGVETGGAEVDMIFESSRLVFSRWQIQCKNTATVSPDDVAKEVGLADFSKSTVIAIVGTGNIGNEARQYANKVMRKSNMAIVMIDRDDIAGIVASPAHILDILNREAEHVTRLKSSHVLELRTLRHAGTARSSGGSSRRT